MKGSNYVINKIKTLFTGIANAFKWVGKNKEEIVKLVLMVSAIGVAIQVWLIEGRSLATDITKAMAVIVGALGFSILLSQFFKKK